MLKNIKFSCPKKSMFRPNWQLLTVWECNEKILTTTTPDFLFQRCLFFFSFFKVSEFSKTYYSLLSSELLFSGCLLSGKTWKSWNVRGFKSVMENQGVVREIGWKTWKFDFLSQDAFFHGVSAFSVFCFQLSPILLLSAVFRYFVCPT